VFSTNVKCGSDELFPKYGQNSKLIEFNRVAIIDTVTAIIEGKVLGFKDNELLPGTIIRLTNEDNKYETVSNIEGDFKFYHIQTGTYRLTADFIGHRQFVKDSLHLGTGDVLNLKIGMGSIGQDDFK